MKIVLSVLRKQLVTALEGERIVFMGEGCRPLERGALMNAIDVVGQTYAHRLGPFIRGPRNPTGTEPHVQLGRVLDVLTQKLAWGVDYTVQLPITLLFDVLDVVEQCERAGLGPFEATIL